MDDLQTSLRDITAALPTAALPVPAVLQHETPGHTVRLLERRDLEGVAHLFHRRFRPAEREPNRVHLALTADYMDRLYLQGPYDGTASGSLVQVDRQGGIEGFLGLLTTRYRIGGEVVPACIVGSLMAAEGARHAAPGPRLLRALSEQPFELQLTDSANRASLAIAMPMRFRLLAFDSLQWLRAFRPAGMLLEMMQRRWTRQPFQLVRPLATGADVLIGQVLAGPAARCSPRFRSEAIDAETFATVATGFLDEFRLRPDWPADELRWLLAHAAEQQINGPLRFGRVSHSDGTTVGCFAFHGEAGGVAVVLQVLANRSGWRPVLDHLMAAADALGCCGITGQGQKPLMPHLFRYPGLIFRYAGGAMVKSGRPDVVAAVDDNGVLAGGLAGDRWTRLSAGDLGLAPPQPGRLGFFRDRHGDA